MQHQLTKTDTITKKIQVMKHNIIICLGLALAMVNCEQKQAANNLKGLDQDKDNAEKVEEFDITKYLEQMKENEELRFAFGAYELKEYALTDLDGDGKNELCVRDSAVNYEAYYAILGDSVELIAYADGGTDLEFYKSAVGYSAYYSPGRSVQGARMLKNSVPTDYYISEEEFNIFSDEQEVTRESYYMNGEFVEKEDIEKFVEQLGEPVEAPTLQWIPIPVDE